VPLTILRGNICGKSAFFDLHAVGRLGKNPKIIGAATKGPEEGVTVINGFVDHLCDKRKGASYAAELASFKAAVEYKQPWQEEQYKALDAGLSRDSEAKGLEDAGRMWYLSVSPDFVPGH
jgi:hypothetical protein